MSTRTTTAHATWRHALLVLTATSAAVAALTLPAAAATGHDHEDGAYTITINGSNAFPESVAAGSHYTYTGSIDDGTIYRGRPGAKTPEPFLPGGRDGRTQATGIKTAGALHRTLLHLHQLREARFQLHRPRHGQADPRQRRGRHP